MSFPSKAYKVLEAVVGTEHISKDQVICEHSNVIITLNRDNDHKIVSGEMTSLFTFNQGKVSVNLKNANADGTVVKLSLISQWCANTAQTKFTMLFSGSEKSRVKFISERSAYGNQKGDFNSNEYNLGFNSGNAFHSYGFALKKDSIFWLVDNICLKREKLLILNTDFNFQLAQWLPDYNPEDVSKKIDKLDPRQLPSMVYLKNFKFESLKGEENQ